MNPFQHGEVFVTDDGAETDLDIGHYERFLDINLEPGRERHDRPGLLDGDRQGAARRVPRRHRAGHPAHHRRDQAPHARCRPPRPSSTSSSPRSAARSATSSRCRSSSRPARCVTSSAASNVFFVHVSLVPYIGAVGRAEDQADAALRRRAALHRHPARRARAAQPTAPCPSRSSARSRSCATSTSEAVVNAIDAPTIYDIPTVLHDRGPRRLRRRRARPRRSATSTGRAGTSCCAACTSPRTRSTVALVGKYIDLPDAYLSVTEALRAGGFAHDTKVVIRWVPSDDCQTPEGAAAALAGVDGICVPGGFGVRGIEGKLGALRSARENGMPDARHLPRPAVHGHRVLAQRARPRRRLVDRSSTPTPPHPVIATMAEQVDDRRRRRRPRRHDAPGPVPGGAAPTGSIVAELYGADRGLRAPPPPLRGEQRLPRPARGGRPGVLRACRPTVASSSSSSCRATCTRTTSPRRRTRSSARRPNDAHPLFRGLVGAALERQQASLLFDVANG